MCAGQQLRDGKDAHPGHHAPSHYAKVRLLQSGRCAFQRYCLRVQVDATHFLLSSEVGKRHFARCTLAPAACNAVSPTNCCEHGRILSRNLGPDTANHLTLHLISLFMILMYSRICQSLS